MEESKTVLVVEDNEKNRKLFSLLIRSMGHECLVAVDGNIGIELAKEGCPDLILMDIQMPSMDGLAALSLLKQNPVTQNIPVVAVTSFAMESDRTRLLEAGFTDYLAKPVDTHQFKTIVQNILERRDAR